MDNQPTPSFSIVIETDNLAAVDIEELFSCLDTLERQEELLRRAEGIFVADGGMVPEALLRDLNTRYPWLTVLRADAGASYVELKLAGALETGSEVIVFCDGDVQYEPGWLAGLLDGFRRHPEADLVAGETTTRINGPYTLAFALTFNFPRFSGETELACSTRYFANNFAVRRSTLERFPLADDPELFRGQCVVHAGRILGASGVILRQPLSRAWHAVLPPSQILQRYFKLGRDAAAIRKITTKDSGRPYLGAMAPDRPGTSVAGRLSDRLRQVARNQPSALLWLPLALPIAAMMGAAYLCGRMTSPKLSVVS